jgi:hypothetical protein
MQTRAVLLFTLGALVSSPARAQPHHFEDTLRGGTSGNAAGGSFGPEGWTVTDVGDRIWYALPRLVSGSVEVTVSNVSEANLPLADHEIFALYEDGYGIGEPIGYAPAFRQNHYKVLLRIYGRAEPARLGAMKLMWGMCPSGAPGYDACACTSFFEEPFASTPPWTGAATRLRVEWGDGHARLLRDGVEVTSVDWTASGLTFGPSELHMMIGSPRNDGGLSAMPIGAVFSDLVVDGLLGDVATCPGSVDAGTLDGGVFDGGVLDGGVCGGAIAAVADGTAAMWETGVFPDATDLNVEGDGTSSSGVAYLRFVVPRGEVRSATLTLNTATTASAGGSSGRICRVEGSWDEASLTWTTRPTVSTTCAGAPRTVGMGEAVSWDVTPLLSSLGSSGGEVSLAVVSTDGDGVHYLSREAGGCTLGPRLALDLSPSPDGGSVEDAGAAIDAAAMDGGMRRGVAGGCGCRAARVESGAPALFFALVLGLAARRSRAR